MAITVLGIRVIELALHRSQSGERNRSVSKLIKCIKCCKGSSKKYAGAQGGTACFSLPVQPTKGSGPNN